MNLSDMTPQAREALEGSDVEVDGSLVVRLVSANEWDALVEHENGRREEVDASRVTATDPDCGGKGCEAHDGECRDNWATWSAPYV
jgi:hypothetical protein